jgi:cAMP-specific phosphodiesterase 4/calcium/calmodulin-dependent 3',5'-cyclic nucleotide phosphodiesterase
MHDPVVLTDGHTYEQRHIEEWLKTHDTSPVSGARLPQKTFFPNHALRNAIEEYFAQVLEDHRRAIKTAVAGLQKRCTFSNNSTLLHTIDALMQCSILVNADLSIERVLTKIMLEAKSLVGAEVASVFLVDRKRCELYSTVNSTGGELRIPMKSGVAGAVAYSGMPLIVANAYDDARFNTQVDSKTGFRTRNILCVPIRAWKSKIIGVAQLINKTSSGIVVPSQGADSHSEGELSFTDDDQQFLEVLAAQAGAAIVNSGMFESMPGVSGAGHWPMSRSSTKEDHQLNACRCPSPTMEPTVGQESGAIDDKCDGASCAQIVETEEGLSTKQFSIVKPLLAAATLDWEIDVLSLAELTDNRPLSTLAMHLFEHHDLIAAFQMDRSKLLNFLTTIERGYPEQNQYHNRAHAASVVHFLHSVLSHGGVAEAAAVVAPSSHERDHQRKFVLLAGLLAAVVHDYEHEGVNNDFLVKSSSPKAILYNDRSPNENHHVAAAWQVLQSSKCNFLENMSVTDYRQLRGLVLDMVLGTDMAEHGNTLKKFKSCVEASSPNDGSSSAGGFAPSSAPDATLALQVALKCADLGHLSLCWSSHLRWVRRLEEEFFAQGDKERDMHAPEISFLMDRKKPGASETQVGFFDFVVLPLFRELCGAFPATRPMLAGVDANYVRWKNIQADLTAVQ